MSYDDPEGAIENVGDEDLYQTVIPQLTVKDIVSSAPSNPDPGDAYIIDQATASNISKKNGISFNSSKKQNVEIPSDSPWNNWDGLTGFTIECYYKTTEDTHGHILFSTQDKLSTTERVEAEILSNGNIQLRLRDSSGNRHSKTVSSNVDPFDGTGHLYTFRYDPENFLDSDAITIFVDGSRGTKESEIIDNTLGQVSNNKFFIGAPALDRPGSQTKIRYENSSDVINVPNSSSLTFDGDFTVKMIWNQYDEVTGNNGLIKKSVDTSTRTFNIFFYGTNASREGQVNFEVETAGGESRFDSGKSLFDFDPDEVVIHCIRQDGVSYILFNGEVVATDNSGNTDTTTTNSDLIMDAGDGPNYEIDEIAVFTEGRLNEARKDPWAEFTGTENNLVAYYKCNDDGTPSTLTDETSNNNDGSINGPVYTTVNNGSFNDDNRPGGTMREFRVWDEALGVETIKENKNTNLTGRENNLSLYLPLVTQDYINRYKDYTTTNNNRTRGNHGFNRGTSISNDGIALNTLSPQNFNVQESFEDKSSLPFLREDVRFEVFDPPGSLASDLQGDAFDGDFAIGALNDNTSTERVGFSSPETTMSIINGNELSKFSFYFYEDSFQNGGGIRLLNTDGTYEVAFATNNPQWILDDGTGTQEQIYSGDGYDRWVFVELQFNWPNNEYGYFIEDQNSGTVKQGTRKLKQGKDIASFESWVYASKWNDFNAKYQMMYDLFEIKNNKQDFNGRNNNIAVFNGTSWQFYDPDRIGNPRAFVESLDRIYRWHNGSWGEINVSGTGASSDSVLQRIESGSLPSNPSDGDAVIDARYNDIEWVRVYNDDTSTWELEGTGNTIYRVDDKSFHWNEGDLDSGLNVSGDTLELDTV